MPDQPKPKRRWFQYSLRTLLLLVAALGIVMATFVMPAVRQRRAVERIKQISGSVAYDYQFHSDGSFAWNGKPAGPNWLFAIIGDDFFISVVKVDFGPGDPFGHERNYRRLTWQSSVTCLTSGS